MKTAADFAIANDDPNKIPNTNGDIAYTNPLFLRTTQLEVPGYSR
jgi:hypothetical protein